ncbi:unnamed protein product [Acanthoscelides obtectus]|uniref:Nuclease HARBI1 n=1 Tax=Acanthoscelides obtectus TaxID=200917 RepID=A0A9P0KKI3_ACAOB|nr:unnamed protein product [Acanthoscelides obtectus]CAK1667598.1 Putative nuclease HARBI1 [Acanthoscelides obtectus]
MAYQFAGVNLIRIIEHVERQRFNADDPFEFSDFNFVKLYRLRKQDVQNLEEMLQPFLPVHPRSHAISNRTKILSALRFFASGSYQLDVGRNHTVTLSQPSISRTLHEVLGAFNTPEILNRYVHFPNTIQELTNTRERFFAKYQVPGIIGCIDCTHIGIVCPIENEHIYINRKHYHSLNVQMITTEILHQSQPAYLTLVYCRYVMKI